MGRLRIGIVGCGAIGSYIAKTCKKELSENIELVGIYDIDSTKAAILAKTLKIKPLELSELVGRVDLIVEAASKEAAGDIAAKALSDGKSLMVMSVGGLIGRKDLYELAIKKKARIIIPSGALSGLDGLKAAGIAKIKSVVLTTKKPKKGLEGAPYLVKNKIDLSKIEKETVVFEGDALSAVQGFPKNVNVAAILSLAGIGPEKTRVRIVASPSGESNIHEVEIVGESGRIFSRTENVPFPENPKTSFLAALSAVAMLKDITGFIKIGT